MDTMPLVENYNTIHIHIDPTIDPDVSIDFYEHDFSSNYHGLPGIPFLNKFNAQIDLPNQIIQLKGQPFTLSRNPFKELLPHYLITDGGTMWRTATMQERTLTKNRRKRNQIRMSIGNINYKL